MLPKLLNSVRKICPKPPSRGRPSASASGISFTLVGAAMLPPCGLPSRRGRTRLGGLSENAAVPPALKWQALQFLWPGSARSPVSRYSVLPVWPECSSAPATGGRSPPGGRARADTPPGHPIPHPSARGSRPPTCGSAFWWRAARWRRARSPVVARRRCPSRGVPADRHCVHCW